MPPLKHAWCGPSSIARVLACTPSARFSEQFPDEGSDYAQEGTDAHELCEYLVRKAIGEKVRNPRNKLKFYCEEMQTHAEEYCSFIMEQLNQAKQTCGDAVLLIEQRVDISKYVPECFGTADCILIADGTMTIVDFKYGTGVLVDAEDNPQLKCYALGALEMFDALYDIDTIRLVIFQPRRSNVSEWSLSKADLMKWAENTLKPKAELAYKGEGTFSAGDHCRFCKAKTVCRKRAEHNLMLAQYDFAVPDTLAESEIPVILTMAENLANWVKDIREYALKQALAGVRYNGYKLVEGKSNRRYTDEESVAAAVTTAGFDPFERKLLGITAMEKMLGKKRFEELLAPFTEKPQGAPTLVPETDKRPEFTTANDDFKD